MENGLPRVQYISIAIVGFCGNTGKLFGVGWQFSGSHFMQATSSIEYQSLTYWIFVPPLKADVAAINRISSSWSLMKSARLVQRERLFQMSGSLSKTACVDLSAGDIFDVIHRYGLVITSIIKCGMKLLIHSQTSTVEPLKFGNG